MLHAGLIGVLTYGLASIFAIAGMGAAGVLIPNYMTLGIAVQLALILGLMQNVGELTVATALNHKKKLIEWKKVAIVGGAAIFLVPLGYLTHQMVSQIIVLATFEGFLIYALYNMSKKPKATRKTAGIISLIIFGAIQGYLGGFIGMDAAPIALLAYASLYTDSKKVSANTAASALIVSSEALILYYLGMRMRNGNMGSGLTDMAIVAIAGILGGITGVALMHKISKTKVKLIIQIILVVAIVEILVKIITTAHI